MKRVFVLLLLMFLLLGFSGCSKSNNSNTSEKYNGKVTNLSKKYLSRGYAINIYRSGTPLGDDAESLGKSNITMAFGILTEYTSTASYNPEADYNIKKVIVTNVKVLSTSKMGTVNDIYIMKRYSQTLNDPHIVVKNINTKYEIENSPPNSMGIQNSLMIELDNIALYDETKSPSAANGNTPTIKQIYDELGITRNEVALKMGFRIELITVSNETLYKDYEIVVPPVGIDIASDTYHYEFYETDTSKMEPFLEKQ